MPFQLPPILRLMITKPPQPPRHPTPPLNLWTYDEVTRQFPGLLVPIKLEGLEVIGPNGIRVMMIRGARDLIAAQTTYNEPSPECKVRCYQVKQQDGTPLPPPETPMHKMIDDVTLFHAAYGHPIATKPSIPPAERQDLRKHLIKDEVENELYQTLAFIRTMPKDLDAHKVSLLAQLADDIADTIYYLIGTALEYGLPLGHVWDAVQKANMDKLWSWDDIRTENVEGKTGWTVQQVPSSSPPTDQTKQFVVKDPTGKVRKPKSWQEPDIKAIVLNAIQPTPQ